MFPETEKYSKNFEEYEKALLYLVSVGFLIYKSTWRLSTLFILNCLINNLTNIQYLNRQSL